MLLDLAGRGLAPSLYDAATGDALLDGLFSKTGYTGSRLWPALTLLPSSAGVDFGSNGPLWSLAYEIVYYASYPAWPAVRQRGGGLAYVAVPALCWAVSVALPFGFAASVLSRYPVWLAGAALAEYPVTLLPAMTRRLSALLLVAAGFGLHVTGVPALIVVAAVVYGVGTVIAAASMPERWLRSRLALGPEFLGVRSHTIYIVHFPFLALVCTGTMENGGRPFSGWLAAAGSLGALAFGSLCFEACERHFRHDPIRIAVPS